MPRGNDKEGQEKALHELGDDFGQGVGNAEALIAANQALRTADLATISSFPVDEEQTTDLDLNGLSGPDGEYVVDAVVRKSGRAQGTVLVYRDDEGRLTKTLADHNLEEVRGTADQSASDGPRRSSRAKAAEDDEDAKGGADASTKASDRAKSKSPATSS